MGTLGIEKVNLEQSILMIVEKSARCTSQEHGLCSGDIVQRDNDSNSTRICECECHNSIYKLMRRMQAEINQ
jgi:hypothetical protein